MQEQASRAVGTVLFIEDDADVREAAGLLLRRHGWRMLAAADPQTAWSVLAAEAVDAVLLDLNFTRGATSGEEGLSGLRALIAHDPQMVVVVVTGHSGINIAVAAMRAGAADFVMKPWSNERLMATLSDALTLRRRRMQAATLDPVAEDHPVGEEPILGASEAMERLRRLVQRAGATRAPVLIYASAGDGKDLVAQTLHRHGGRDEPLVKIDLTAADAADRIRAAPPEAAVLLDRLDEADAVVQATLLAVLEPRSDVRLISTSRVGLEALRSRVRQDLLYRLNIIEIEIPPLHRRPDDVLTLASHYLTLFARRHGRPARSLSDSATEALSQAPWPGGTRELRTRMERAVLLAEGQDLEPEDFDLHPPELKPVAAPPSLAQTERTLVEAALKRHNFNVSRAAEELGLTRAALYRRMAKHGF